MKKTLSVLVVLLVVGLLFLFAGGGDWLTGLLFPKGPLLPTTVSPMATESVFPAPADPTQNSPQADFFQYVETLVPTEMKEKVKLSDLFGQNEWQINQYFDSSVYVQANTEIAVVSVQRARSSSQYAELYWPENFLTKLIGKNGQVLYGSKITVLVNGDVFLVVGTTPGSALDGIDSVTVEDNTLTIHSNVQMQALYLGFNVSAQENNPQLEFETLATPDSKLDAWLLISERVPSESDLTSMGVSTVAKEATWLLLNKDGEKIWTKFKDSVENPGDGHAYDVLAPYIKDAFCKKIDEKSQLFEAEGMDSISCDDIQVVVQLTAKLPHNEEGKEGVEFLRMSHTGFYVQNPELMSPVE